MKSPTDSPVKAMGDDKVNALAMQVTATPQPGLIVQGEVHLNNVAGPGQADNCHPRGLFSLLATFEKK
jgi:hypothetical protein